MVQIKDLTGAKTVQTYLNNVADKAKGNWFWIGLTDVQSEGSFVWTLSQTNLTWSYWYPGEPNGRTVENCVVATHFTDRTWFDVQCSWSKFLYWNLIALCQFCK